MAALITISSRKADVKWVTTEAGLQYVVDDGTLTIMADGPDFAAIEIKIPIDEAKRDLGLMLALIAIDEEQERARQEGIAEQNAEQDADDRIYREGKYRRD